MNSNEMTSWVNYPEMYKFFSLHFELNQDIYKVDRVTYDSLDLIGDIGGVLGFLIFVLKASTTPFSVFRLYALIANRIFILPQTSRKKILDKIDLTDEELK